MFFWDRFPIFSESLTFPMIIEAILEGFQGWGSHTDSCPNIPDAGRSLAQKSGSFLLFFLYFMPLYYYLFLLYGFILVISVLEPPGEPVTGTPSIFLISNLIINRCTIYFNLYLT